ncbi:MAG TPA: outer membrane protein assembly factor BamE [Burkholderiales bacterium]|nr:outer membrane protein assembly factor BamE [Burkholderiales bacterium]
MRIVSLLLLLFLASCSALSEYHVPIMQGNYVTQKSLDQLSQGMTRSQVQAILGSPLVMDVFHQNRWDYVYLYNDGYRKVTENRISVYFDGDSMTKVAGKGLPEAPLIASTEDKKGFFSRLFDWF